MTEEQIVKGRELLDRLNKLKIQKKNWEVVERFISFEVAYRSKTSGYEHIFFIDGSCIDFNDLKQLVIAKISKEIEQAQREFNAL